MVEFNGLYFVYITAVFTVDNCISECASIEGLSESNACCSGCPDKCLNDCRSMIKDCHRDLDTIRCDGFFQTCVGECLASNAYADERCSAARRVHQCVRVGTASGWAPDDAKAKCQAGEHPWISANKAEDL